MNIIIDGNNLLHRAFWASKNAKYADSNNTKQLSAFKSEPDKEPPNSYCVYLFLKSVRSYVEMFNPTDVYITWDKKLKFPSTNFRKEAMKGGYKQNRDKSSSADIFTHEELIESICGSLGLKNMYPNVLEADDVIAWLSKKVSPNMIISVDNDLLQLIDSQTSFYHLNKKIVLNLANFEEHVSVPKNAFLYYKAILGDNSDTIEGFPGHGKIRSKKLAMQLAEHNGDITKLSLSPDYVDIFNRNLRLMDLSQGYKIETEDEQQYNIQFDSLKGLQPRFDKFAEWVQILGFNSIVENFEEWKAIFTFNQSNSTLVEQLS